MDYFPTQDPNQSLQSEAQLRSLFEAAVDTILVIDERGIIISANPACLELLGWEGGDLIGRNVGELMPSYERERHDGYIERYLETGKKNIIGVGREVDALHRDGRLIPVRLSVSEGNVDGRRIFTGILHDVSERRQAEQALKASEERFRLLVQTAGSVILCLSPGYEILEWNAEAERVYGYSRDEVLGRHYLELVLPEEERAGVAGELRGVLEGHSSRGYESSVVSRDGRRVVLLWNATRLLGSSGEPDGIIACGQDITEYKRVMTELVQKQSLVRLGEMAAVVAHEVRNPIAGIGGALRIIEGHLGHDSSDRPVIAEIQDRLSMLSSIVQDILLFARPQKPQLNPVPVIVLIEDTIALLAEDPEFSSVEVCVSGPEQRVLADAELLKSVFLNLLVNAGQAMDGRGTISILVAGDAECCRIVFCDDGHGVSAGVLDKIFEPFFTTKHRGTGLGLPYARRMVEQHGGAISVESGHGEGAEVTVTLPLDLRSRSD